MLTAQHDHGVAYLYVNESDGLVLDEETEFILKGLRVAGHDSNTVAFKLKSGETKLIKLERDAMDGKGTSLKQAIAYDIYKE